MATPDLARDLDDGACSPEGFQRLPHPVLEVVFGGHRILEPSRDGAFAAPRGRTLADGRAGSGIGVRQTVRGSLDLLLLREFNAGVAERPRGSFSPLLLFRVSVASN